MLSKILVNYFVLYMVFFISAMLYYLVMCILYKPLFDVNFTFSAYTLWFYFIAEVVLCLLRALFFYLSSALLWNWQYSKNVRTFFIWMLVWLLETVLHNYSFEIYKYGFFKVLFSEILTFKYLLGAVLTFGIFTWIYRKVGYEFFRGPTVLG